MIECRIIHPIPIILIINNNLIPVVTPHTLYALPSHLPIRLLALLHAPPSPVS